jgi:predicted transcriptional regulator
MGGAWDRSDPVLNRLYTSDTIEHMSKTQVITARVQPEISESLNRLAVRSQRSRAWVIQKAVERYVAQETEFQNFVQAGIDSADRGDLISQEEMEGWFEERKANRAMRIAAE